MWPHKQQGQGPAYSPDARFNTYRRSAYSQTDVNIPTNVSLVIALCTVRACPLSSDVSGQLDILRGVRGAECAINEAETSSTITVRLA